MLFSWGFRDDVVRERIRRPTCLHNLCVCGLLPHVSATARQCNAALLYLPITRYCRRSQHNDGAGRDTRPCARLKQDISSGAARNAVADAANKILVIAPFFQVVPRVATKCSTLGVSVAQAGDFLWTYGSWLSGGRANNCGQIASFAALDALVNEIVGRWPGLRLITIAGL